MTSALEDIKIIDLEEWLTLATAPAPTKLKQGQSPNMQNVWIDEKPGSVITANGFKKVGQIPSGNAVTFCINYFKTSSGTQTFVVSDNATVWTTVDFQNFTSIITGLSSSYQLRGKVIRDKLWLTNGIDSVRTFDGTTVTILDNSGGLTPNVPKGRYIDYHDERVWLYHIPSNRSQCAFSALTDSSGTIIAPDDVNAWPSSNTLQVSEGDADFGTGLIIYRGYLHFFKQYSIWRLAGYDEYTYTRIKTRASTGTRFNESVQILDDLAHLIGIDGIYVFDGDTAVRISDIIDPATASQTAFGFNQLQQPNTNNQFWEVASTADFNAGTVPTNLSIDSEADFVAADDSQADFQSGATQTNLDLTTTPGRIFIDHSNSGVGPTNIASGLTPTLNYINNGSQVGNINTITTGSPSYFGAGWNLNGSSLSFTIPLGVTRKLTRIIFRGLQSSTDVLFQFADDSGTVIPSSATLGSLYNVNQWDIQGAFLVNGTDVTFNFSAFSGTFVTVIITGVSGGAGRGTAFSYIEIYETLYYSTAKFTSKTLDLGAAPNSLGNFNAFDDVNGEGISYFTQTSNDGSSWDAEVACTNGGAIGSTSRRYIRWGANFTSSGNYTPWIDAAYLPSQYISAIHNTAGGIFAWGPFQVDFSSNGETINFYYRTATTSGGIPSAPWNLIVSSGVISDPIANQYVQFKFEILGGDATHLPTVKSVTINWIVGTGVQPQTLQNVASTYWRNRYWLSAAGPSATTNDTILIRGKKTFGSPWMLKNWQILSFTRFQDSLYGGSSVDGSIYQLDTGYSKDGNTMDSYFETMDFTFGGFTANVIEGLIEIERMGMWSLTVGYSVDGGNTWTEKTINLSLSTFDGNFMKRLNINVTTTRIRFRFRTNDIDTPFQVHRFMAFYKMESERGSIRGDYRAA